MDLTWPIALLGLLLVPLGVALYVLRERRGGRQPFASPALLPSVAPRRPGPWRHVPPVLYLVAVILLVVAVARPTATVAVDVEQASVMLVTDRSGSMRSQDVAPDRMAAARRAGVRFLDRTPRQVRIGGLAFNQSVEVLAAPGTDRSSLRRATQSLRGRGSTAAGDAMTAALRILRPPGSGQRTPAAIVLLSDGESVRGRDPVQVAQVARRAGVRVYTIALGTDAGTLTSRNPDGSTKTERVPPDRTTLRRVAQITGGRYFEAADAATVDAVYERLGSSFAKRREEREMSHAAVGGALGLVLIGAALSLVHVGRLP